MRLAVLLDTGNVGPEPSIHLGPGHILVTVFLRVSRVKNVFQKTVSLLQVRDANITETNKMLRFMDQIIVRSHSLGGTHPPLGLPSSPLTTASLVHLQWIPEGIGGDPSSVMNLPNSQTGAGFWLDSTYHKWFVK